MQLEEKNKFHWVLAVHWLQLTGILVLQMVRVLKHVQFKYFNGTELKKTFQTLKQQIQLLRELEVLLKKNEKISPTKQIQSENMIAYGVWHAFQFVLHKLSKLINQTWKHMIKQKELL